SGALCSSSLLFSLIVPCPSTATLFPYTTLFRSQKSTKRTKGVLPFAVIVGFVQHVSDVFFDLQTRRAEVEKYIADVLDEADDDRSEEHTSELQSLAYLVCRLLLEKNKAHHVSLD